MRGNRHITRIEQAGPLLKQAMLATHKRSVRHFATQRDAYDVLSRFPLVGAQTLYQALIEGKVTNTGPYGVMAALVLGPEFFRPDRSYLNTMPRVLKAIGLARLLEAPTYERFTADLATLAFTPADQHAMAALLAGWVGRYITEQRITELTEGSKTMQVVAVRGMGVDSPLKGV